MKELVGFSYILIYVDDIIVISKEMRKYEEIKSKLAHDFDVKETSSIVLEWNSLEKMAKYSLVNGDISRI